MSLTKEDITMKTEIITRVAEYIRSPGAKKKIDEGKTAEVKDSYEFSKAAAGKLKDSQKYDSQIEKERFQKLENIKSRVNAGEYTLNDQMVDDIAEKIIKLL